MEKSVIVYQWTSCARSTGGTASTPVAAAATVEITAAT